MTSEPEQAPTPREPAHFRTEFRPAAKKGALSGLTCWPDGLGQRSLHEHALKRRAFGHVFSGTSALAFA